MVFFEELGTSAKPSPSLKHTSSRLTATDDEKVKISLFISYCQHQQFREAAQLLGVLPQTFVKHHFDEENVTLLITKLPASLTILAELIHWDCVNLSAVNTERLVLGVVTFMTSEKLYRHAQIEQEQFPEVPILQVFQICRHIVIAASKRTPLVETLLEKHVTAIDKTLEGLGCHGLVSTQNDPVLIDIIDASEMELTQHRSKLTGLADSLSSLNISREDPKQKESKKKHTSKKQFLLSDSGKDLPESASHQRQVFVKLADVESRLHRNEIAREILLNALRCPEINSLVRVLSRRIKLDSELLHEYKFLSSLSQTLQQPRRFGQNNLTVFLSGAEEVIFHFMVQFRKSFQLALSWLKQNENEPQTPGEQSEDTLEGLSSDSSLIGTPQEQFKSQSVESLNAPVQQREMNAYAKLKHRNDDFPAEFFPGNISVSPGRGIVSSQIDNLQAEIQRLSIALNKSNRELEEFKTTKSSATPIPIEGRAMDSESLNWHRTVEHFQNMYRNDHAEVMKAFDALPDISGSVELQQTILLSIIVLAFRKIGELLSKIDLDVRTAVAQNVDCEPLDDDPAYVDTIHWPVRSYLKNCYWEKVLFNISKSITSQIWSTLFDFPSIKTCHRFNRFILDCVRMAWTLSTDKRGFAIDCNAQTFDPALHERYECSDEASSTISKYIWPTLSCDDQCLAKAVVIT